MKIRRKTTRLGELLVHAGIISEDQLDQALDVQRTEEPERNIGNIIVELGFCTQEEITFAVEKQEKLRNGGLDVLEHYDNNTVETQLDEISELSDDIIKKAK